MLLFYGILEPSSDSSQATSLAAVRFSSPVCVNTIRLFPTGAQPFKQKPDAIARTEPSSVYLDVYFNAVPIPDANGTQKHKPTNALVPTTIAYPGGQLDFKVGMEFEFATRLMIIRGAFTSLTIAVYGEQVQQASPLPANYEPRALPHIEPAPLSLALDPSKSMESTSLARKLLKLIPDQPDLLLVTRLMFCLKPKNDDWENPDFPHIYSNLKGDFFDLTLEKAVEIISRPVSDSEDPETIKDFALRVVDCLESYDDDDAYQFAKVLSHSASQVPCLAQALTSNVDLGKLFAASNLDKPILLYLLDAAASIDIARQLRTCGLLDTLSMLKNSPVDPIDTQRIAGRLFDRIVGWEVFEDAMSNSQASFTTAAAFVRDVALEETSFGVWLANVLSHSDFMDRISENAGSPHLLPDPQALWDKSLTASHDEFMAFMRAFIGVSAVLVVYAWTDSMEIYYCKERSQQILRQWQGVEGYREIVNHLLLMRQIVYRLQYMLPGESDDPKAPSLEAEHIFKELALHPYSMLRKDFREVMQLLPSPLNYITDEEVVVFRKVADLASEGLPGAVKVLLHDIGDVEDWHVRLRLRVALETVIASAHHGQGALLGASWQEGQSNITPSLIEHLGTVRSVISSRFGLTLPSRRTQREVASIFRISGQLLDTLMIILTSHAAAQRDLVTLVQAIADIFVCTDSADMSYNQDGEACASAHAVRERIVAMASWLVNQPLKSKAIASRASLVLRTLLDCAFLPGDHDAGHYMTQVFWLFDHALPQQSNMSTEDGTEWVNSVLPGFVPQLRKFYSKQEGDNRSHLIRRFLEIDGGRFGISEWLLSEEHRLLYDTIRSARRNASDAGLRAVYQAKVCVSLQVLTSLVQSTSESSSSWAIRLLLRDEDGAAALEKNIGALLVQNVYYESMGALASLLASHCDAVASRLRISLVIVLLRDARCRLGTTLLSVPQLFVSGHDLLGDQSVMRELGGAFEVIASCVRSPSPPLDGIQEATAQILVNLMDSIPSSSSQSTIVIPALSNASLTDICTWLKDSETLSQDMQNKIDGVKDKFTVIEHQLPALSVVAASDAVSLTFGTWQDMMAPSTPVPSTPKRKSPAQSAELTGMVTVSPTNALLRSPEVKGLTKVYANNDFRQLRQVSAARQNTSRLPSMHVDDFEQGAPNTMVPLTNLASPIAGSFATAPRPPSLPANPMTLMQNYAFQSG